MSVLESDLATISPEFHHARAQRIWSRAAFRAPLPSRARTRNSSPPTRAHKQNHTQVLQSLLSQGWRGYAHRAQTGAATHACVSFGSETLFFSVFQKKMGVALLSLHVSPFVVRHTPHANPIRRFSSSFKQLSLNSHLSESKSDKSSRDHSLRERASRQQRRELIFKKEEFTHSSGSALPRTAGDRRCDARVRAARSGKPRTRRRTRHQRGRVPHAHHQGSSAHHLRLHKEPQGPQPGAGARTRLDLSNARILLERLFGIHSPRPGRRSGRDRVPRDSRAPTL